MPRLSPRATLAVALLLRTGSLIGQEKAGGDHSIILEIGGAGEWKLTKGPYQVGATVAAEIEPVENWLELEFGVTALVSGGRTELGADLLFKKPWRLSPKAEFMAGLGPQLVHRFARDERGTSFGLEVVLDFMYWPAKNVGWYFEPSYGVTFGREGERSLGATAGLLVGWP
jgi:hypothetical protein